MVIQHVAHEGLGLIGTALDAAGIEVQLYRTDQGESLPPSRVLRSLGGLVVLGGPMHVNQDREHPWLQSERDLLEAAVEEGLVVLGVCLGAQQLAVALGGTASAGPALEIGPGQVLLTEEGAADPVLGPAGSPLPCFQWHSWTFSVPDGGVRLSGNAMFANQAFRMGPKAYGLQFHVEIDHNLAKAWEPHFPEGVVLTDEAREPIEQAGSGILERLVGLGDR
jgi:GMP synthase-like glutamine amidotransferase